MYFVCSYKYTSCTQFKVHACLYVSNYKVIQVVGSNNVI